MRRMNSARWPAARGFGDSRTTAADTARSESRMGGRWNAAGPSVDATPSQRGWEFGTHTDVALEYLPPVGAALPSVLNCNDMRRGSMDCHGNSSQAIVR